jgi:hypothetical protein
LSSPTIALPPWIGVALLSCVTGAAFFKGGRPERIAAGGITLGVLAGFAMRDRHWSGTQWADFAIDLIFFLLILAIALRSDRYWPIWAAGFQLLAVITHAASLIDAGLAPWAYVTAGVIWTYLVMGALAVGTYEAWRGAHPAISGAPAAAAGETRR